MPCFSQTHGTSAALLKEMEQCVGKGIGGKAKGMEAENGGEPDWYVK